MKNTEKVLKASIMDLNIEHPKIKEIKFTENMFKDNNLKVKTKDHKMTKILFLSTIIILAETISPDIRLLFKFILCPFKFS
ncbi:hypothetical protein AtNW77_Chr1g0045401 [Arabidopsis thaliana]|uniref:Transmembrane protein n=2 Tax=Arabidopsis TaxID=3701 RepID=Q9C634_ARATH|nr:uncharacterized protein AT1G46336 [Arabidopsis thaliana]AAG50619.1 hypothetical protein [Arabidopsis thaliana]AEE32125.1 transmembrane protein [Arabidopsis thaliana]KAG7648810.1 hypothetical protein ISN45_At01g038910 [Arabidopsis thaliana x Arabidopsis arenosa]|eukprot:NP_175143.1 transmembrane protein [Arabidopsis thaliana]